MPKRSVSSADDKKAEDKAVAENKKVAKRHARDEQTHDYASRIPYAPGMWKRREVRASVWLRFVFVVFYIFGG